ncbi:MAG: tetratricopeptide repeat protein [Pseudomonadota bacterium]
MTATPALASYEEGKAAYEKRDWFNAVRLLRPLAEQGNDRALVLLGNMYMDGKGVEASPEKALAHYKQALVNNNSNAMLNIATMYAEGLAVDKNFETAFDWYTKSAEHGNPAAQFLLGSVHIKGHPELPNLKGDMVTAYMWFRIAAKQKELPEIGEVADEFSKRLVQQLSPDQIMEAEKRAKAWKPANPSTDSKGEE